MNDEKKAVNFTIVPAEDHTTPRVYSNFCSIQNSPIDFTLTFCEMLPLGEREIKQAQATHLVKAPDRSAVRRRVKNLGVRGGLLNDRPKGRG